MIYDFNKALNELEIVNLTLNLCCTQRNPTGKLRRN